MIAFPASHPSSLALGQIGPHCIPLPVALLCLDCESITASQRVCPSCGSHELHPLSAWLGTMRAPAVWPTRAGLCLPRESEDASTDADEGNGEPAPGALDIELRAEERNAEPGEAGEEPAERAA